MNLSQDYMVLDWRDDETVSPEQASIISEYRITVELSGEPVMTIMCTPGDDEDLVVGRLFTEGFIDSFAEVAALSFSPDGDFAVVAHVELAGAAGAAGELVETPLIEIPSVGAGSQVLRRFAERTTRDSFLTRGTYLPWDPRAVFALEREFSHDSPLHKQTGGTHSCYMMIDSAIVCRAEDIGRHNTVDKVIGWALRNGADMTRAVVFISGRVPTDMMVKAVRAKFAVFATKKMPTRQAIDMARKYRATLVCDVNHGHLKVFSGMQPLGADGE